MAVASQGSLSHCLRQQQPLLDDEQCSYIIKQLLLGVEYMHLKDIVHRDLKPENIMLHRSKNTPLGRYKVKIADFGLSVQSEANQFQNQQCGTVMYMAPELILKKPYYKPVDLWNVGIIMYELITNKHPFLQFGHDRNIYISKITQSTIDWKFSHQFSQFAQDFFLQLVKIQPSERYSADQALKHPWITRNFDSFNPMTFEQKTIAFQKSEIFITIVRSIYFYKYYQKIYNKQYNFLNQNNKQNSQVKTEIENEKEYESQANTDNNVENNLNKSQQLMKKHFKNSRSLGYSQNIQLSSNNSNNDIKNKQTYREKFQDQLNKHKFYKKSSQSSLEQKPYKQQQRYSGYKRNTQPQEKLQIKQFNLPKIKILKTYTDKIQILNTQQNSAANKNTQNNQQISQNTYNNQIKQQKSYRDFKIKLNSSSNKLKNLQQQQISNQNPQADKFQLDTSLIENNTNRYDSTIKKNHGSHSPTKYQQRFYQSTQIAADKIPQTPLKQSCNIQNTNIILRKVSSDCSNISEEINPQINNYYQINKSKNKSKSTTKKENISLKNSIFKEKISKKDINKNGDYRLKKSQVILQGEQNDSNHADSQTKPSQSQNRLNSKIRSSNQVKMEVNSEKQKNLHQSNIFIQDQNSSSKPNRTQTQRHKPTTQIQQNSKKFLPNIKNTAQKFI